MPCDAGSIAGRNPMFGLITRRHLVKHPVTVCRDYGWRVFVVGLFLRRGTFLELVASHPADRAVPGPIAPLADRPEQEGVGAAGDRTSGSGE